MKIKRFVFAFSLFLLFFQKRAMWLWCVFSGSCALFVDPQISFFNKIFIKNRSHGTIHTFKNYFTIVFSVLNKISGYPEGPLVSIDYNYRFHIIKIKKNNNKLVAIKLIDYKIKKITFKLLILFFKIN